MPISTSRINRDSSSCLCLVQAFGEVIEATDCEAYQYYSAPDQPNIAYGHQRIMLAHFAFNAMINHRGSHSQQ